MVRLAVIITALAVSQSAFAAETVTYSYDAHGRLVKAAHSGTVNANVQTQYCQDKADNRTRVKTTNTANPTQVC